MHILAALRAANIARNNEWENKATPFTLVFWANELAGEVGEACNILKKLDREFNYNVRGSRATMAALAEELGDIVICCDLLGMCASVDYPSAGCWPAFPKVSAHDYSRYGVRLMANAGRACAIVDKFDRKSGNEMLASTMQGLMRQTKATADLLGVDLERTVRTKFNMTSEKLGLKTRL